MKKVKYIKDYIKKIDNIASSTNNFYFTSIDYYELISYINKYIENSDVKSLKEDLDKMNLRREMCGVISFADKEMKYTALWAVLCSGHIYECESINHNKFYIFNKPNFKDVIMLIETKNILEMEFTVNRLNGDKDVYHMCPFSYYDEYDKDEYIRFNRIMYDIKNSYLIITDGDFHDFIENKKDKK